jgi:heterodisulfide reductase subunit C
MNLHPEERTHMQESLRNTDFFTMEAFDATGKFDTTACFQCRKCSGGCPVTFAMDLLPDQVVRLVQLGQQETVLQSRTIWVCASCETCTTRCPNGVKIAELMDGLKELAIRSGVVVPQPQVRALHETFIADVAMRGRIFEGMLLPMYWIRSGSVKRMVETGSWKVEMQMGWKMFKKGRLPLFPKGIKGKSEIRAILKPSKTQEKA